MNKSTVSNLFPLDMSWQMEQVIKKADSITEIRIGVGKPIQIQFGKQRMYLAKDGSLLKDYRLAQETKRKEIDELLNHLCHYSVYAYANEIQKGYFTVEGGHRIGIVGQTVLEKEEVQTIKYISGFNIRIAHEIKGIAKSILEMIFENGKVRSTLIVSPPGCGKTTLLRDMVRILSNGDEQYCGMNVGLVDERSEVAACYMGVAQNDIGLHTWILDGCPKATGMVMLLRSMAPDVIAVDELGSQNDIDAVETAFYSGCIVIATIHGNNYEQIIKSARVASQIRVGGFERIIILSGRRGAGTMEEIRNENGEIISGFENH